MFVWKRVWVGGVLGYGQGEKGLSKLVEESSTFWAGSKVAMIVESTESMRGVNEASNVEPQCPNFNGTLLPHRPTEV